MYNKCTCKYICRHFMYIMCSKENKYIKKIYKYRK